MNGSGFGLGSGLADGLASDGEDKNDMAIHTYNKYKESMIIYVNSYKH